MKLTERADKFAAKFVTPKPEPDNRSREVKLAEFHSKWSSSRHLKKAKQDYKKDK